VSAVFRGHRPAVGIAPQLTAAEPVTLAAREGRTLIGDKNVMQRMLAPTAVIRHNDHTGEVTLRPLTSYDR
jgi:hypothetical protein